MTRIHEQMYLEFNQQNKNSTQTEAQHKTGIKIWLFHDSDTIISLVVEHD